MATRDPELKTGSPRTEPIVSTFGPESLVQDARKSLGQSNRSSTAQGKQDANSSRDGANSREEIDKKYGKKGGEFLAEVAACTKRSTPRDRAQTAEERRRIVDACLVTVAAKEKDTPPPSKAKTEVTASSTPSKRANETPARPIPNGKTEVAKKEVPREAPKKLPTDGRPPVVVKSGHSVLGVDRTLLLLACVGAASIQETNNKDLKCAAASINKEAKNRIAGGILQFNSDGSMEDVIETYCSTRGAEMAEEFKQFRNEKGDLDIPVEGERAETYKKLWNRVALNDPKMFDAQLRIADRRYFTPVIRRLEGISSASRFAAFLLFDCEVTGQASKILRKPKLQELDKAAGGDQKVFAQSLLDIRREFIMNSHQKEYRNGWLARLEDYQRMLNDGKLDLRGEISLKNGRVKMRGL